MPYAQLSVFVSPSSPSTAGFAQPAGFGGGETCSPNSHLRPPQVGEEFAPSPLVGSTLEGIKVGGERRGFSYAKFSKINPTPYTWCFGDPINDSRRQGMLKVLFGSQTGILSIITVLGATAVVVGFSYWMYRKSLEKDK